MKTTPTCRDNKAADFYWDPSIYECVGGKFYDCATGGYGYKSIEKCREECAPTPPRYFATKSINRLCNLPVETGNNDCEDAKPGLGYFFDVTTGQCKPFAHRGCGLNSNNFPTLQECEEQCAVGSPYQEQMKVPLQSGVTLEEEQQPSNNNNNGRHPELQSTASYSSVSSALMIASLAMIF